MQYRRFGKLTWQVSALGFGAMRLPILGGDSGRVDEAAAIRMIRHAIDQGVNYIDTAYPYHQGQSEIVVGKALQNGYRQKVKLVTKSPLWLVRKQADFERFLQEQLAKLQTNGLDFYLLHALDRDKWTQVQSLHVFDWAKKALASGQIKHFGFSFHDSFTVFKEIVDAYDWTFCQIQYNFLDVDFQAGRRGLEYAAKKGLAVVIMEPLRGGELAQPPTAIQQLWRQAKPQRTPVEWALQWLWDQPAVSTVLSGMSSLPQVKENLASADRSGVNALTSQQRETVEKVRQAYHQREGVPCTGCQYCLPCPSGVNIPRIFKIFNAAQMRGSRAQARQDYQNLDPGQRVDQCRQCHRCEQTCPQAIKIATRLQQAHEFLTRQP